MTLYETLSAITAILVVIVWLRPRTFRFLVDKESQEPSLGRQGQYIALLVSTWALVYETIDGKLTEWFFTTYMLAWAGAQFGSLWLKIKAEK